MQKCTAITKSLKGKHVVITGGSSGIGKSVGKLAAKLGAHVTILARDAKKLESALEEIISTCSEKENQTIKAISLDVTDPQNVEEVLKQIDNDIPVFALVNCAGMAICGQIEELSNADNRKLVDLNLMGTIYCVRTLLPSLKQRQEGVIVITASQAALFGIFGLATYSASKYALRGFAEGLEMEVRPHNISVTLALPPDTDTPGFLNENKNKPQETHLISESGGLFSPDDVAKQLIDDALVSIEQPIILVCVEFYINIIITFLIAERKILQLRWFRKFHAEYFMLWDVSFYFFF